MQNMALTRVADSMDMSLTLPPNEYSGDRLIHVVIAFIILNTAFLALRIWSRRIQRSPFRADEFFVIAGYIVILGVCTASICTLPSPTLRDST
jgi:hypothetical protein